MDLKSQIAEYTKRIEATEQNIKTLKSNLAELKASKRTLEKLNLKAESLKPLQEIIKHS